MTRDESSGGWLAQDGGLSRVGVCRLLPDLLPGRFSFLIHGERLKDRQVRQVHLKLLRGSPDVSGRFCRNQTFCRVTVRNSDRTVLTRTQLEAAFRTSPSVKRRFFKRLQERLRSNI